MKAIQQVSTGGADAYSYCDVPDPEPGDGEVVVNVEAVNVGMQDAKLRSGDSSGFYPSRGHGGQSSSLPFIPGNDFAGTVDRVGPGVAAFSPGDFVAGVSSSGAFAEKTLAAAASLRAVPSGVSAIEAASVPVVGITAYMTISELDIDKGDPVLVTLAHSGLGCYLGGILNNMGAEVIGVVPDAERAAAVAQLGYSHTICSDTDSIADRVAEITDGNGVRVSYDLVMGPQLADCFDALGVRGTVMTVGSVAGFPGGDVIEQHFVDNFDREPRWSIFSMDTAQSVDPDAREEGFRTIYGYFADGDLDIPSESLPLSEAYEATERILAASVTGKMMLVPGLSTNGSGHGGGPTGGQGQGASE
jgi:NADPH2:quinone reductase